MLRVNLDMVILRFLVSRKQGVLVVVMASKGLLRMVVIADSLLDVRRMRGTGGRGKALTN